jgi:hypothetical protein
MNIRIYGTNPARPVRLLICAALACAITGVTTEVIVSSANHLEYGIGASGVTATVQADARQGVALSSAA